MSTRGTKLSKTELWSVRRRDGRREEQEKRWGGSGRLWEEGQSPVHTPSHPFLSPHRQSRSSKRDSYSIFPKLNLICSRLPLTDTLLHWNASAITHRWQQIGTNTHASSSSTHTGPRTANRWAKVKPKRQRHQQSSCYFIFLCCLIVISHDYYTRRCLCVKAEALRAQKPNSRCVLWQYCQ